LEEGNPAMMMMMMMKQAGKRGYGKFLKSLCDSCSRKKCSSSDPINPV
jgi:hypothetical protein